VYRKHVQHGKRDLRTLLHGCERFDTIWGEYQTLLADGRMGLNRGDGNDGYQVRDRGRPRLGLELDTIDNRIISICSLTPATNFLSLNPTLTNANPNLNPNPNHTGSIIFTLRA
jgi:hypothetical protein